MFINMPDIVWHIQAHFYNAIFFLLKIADSVCNFPDASGKSLSDFYK